MKSAKQLSDEVIRCFERAYKLEIELVQARRAQDEERTDKILERLDRTLRLTKRAVDGFKKAITERNPGSVP